MQEKEENENEEFFVPHKEVIYQRLKELRSIIISICNKIQHDPR